MVETTLGLRTLSSLDATKNEMWQEVRDLKLSRSC